MSGEIMLIHIDLSNVLFVVLACYMTSHAFKIDS